jgi:8-oxo-dGTP pyrophosphatase MutT (NUDIX family)
MDIPVARRGEAAALQCAALCWRLNKSGKVQVLLITSLDTGRWVIPKGWPAEGEAAAAAAAREAWEEAGVEGKAQSAALGSYGYDKVLADGSTLRCAVAVHALAVTRRAKAFPEKGRRRARWLRPAKAAKLVVEPDLAALLAAFAPDAGASAAAPVPGAPPAA